MQAPQAGQVQTAFAVKARSLPTVFLSPADLADVGGCLLLPESISAKVQARNLQVRPKLNAASLFFGCKTCM